MKVLVFETEGVNKETVYTHTSYFSLIPLKILMVSWIVGSLTWIGRNRLAKATSFSIVRYSFRVVAPQHCNSPLDRAGFKRLLASILPSAFPRPNSVCSSSTNLVILVLNRKFWWKIARCSIAIVCLIKNVQNYATMCLLDLFIC